MNPYSQLGVDNTTMGYLSQAGIDPTMGIQQPAAYPSYPNAAGAGSQTAGTQQNAAPPIASAQNNTQSPETSPRGLSPYSLVGDANYRMS